MLDPNSFTALRRARESAQAVEPTVYDAPPQEPDVYGDEQYPPGFGPNAAPPDRQFQLFAINVVSGAPQRVNVNWYNPEYFVASLDTTPGMRLGIFRSDQVDGQPLGLIGPGGRCKIPLNPNQRDLWLIALTATTCVGICSYTRGCEHENVF